MLVCAYVCVCVCVFVYCLRVCATVFRTRLLIDTVNKLILLVETSVSFTFLKNYSKSLPIAIQIETNQYFFRG